MTYIERKIYYDLFTGNVIQDTGERMGDVVETTVEQDFQTYLSLAERVPSTIGVIKIPYGQDSEKFLNYAYHVDINTHEIVWDLTPRQYEEEQEKATLQQQIDILNQAIAELSLFVGGNN